tara:strand:+ start:377 stop:613 length:237 start_codon:yes stop_codon:yes gene_type:complete
MRKFIISMFGSGDTSIKRVIAFLGFLIITLIMILNCFLHERFEPSYSLIEAVKVIVLVCVGGNVAEKFFSKKTKETND